MTEPNTAIEFEIQPAASRDLDTIQKWLPQAFLGAPRPQFLAAKVPGHDQLVGAASMRVIVTDQKIEQARFLLFVEEPSRRRGCGTALYHAILEAAQQTSATELLAGRSLDASDEQTQFFTGLGLTPVQERILFEVTPEQLLARYQRLREQIEESDRLGDDFSMVSVGELPPEEVAAFTLRHMGGFLESYLSKLRTGRYCPHSSLAALVSGRLVGVILTRTTGDVTHLDVLALERDYRDGCLSSVLKHEMAHRLAQHGVRTVRFEADEKRQRATVKAGRLSGSTELSRKLLFGRSLTRGH